MDQGSNIMVVADVFTALTENRPYREAMSPIQTLKVLKQMERENAVHPDPLNLLEKHIEVLFAISEKSRREAKSKYNKIFQYLA
jgi:HD-GYP domain-containing protein (c-di-GMP phosphodiesterase class II)